MKIEKCPMCGSPIRVVSADEGTCYYEPVDEWTALGALEKAHRRVLEVLGQRVSVLSAQVSSTDACPEDVPECPTLRDLGRDAAAEDCRDCWIGWAGRRATIRETPGEGEA